MKRIKDISELAPGDRIWRIKRDFSLEIMEFVCLCPHSTNLYSVFIDRNLNGMPKFDNTRFTIEEWYMYDKNTCNDINIERLRKLEMKVRTVRRNVYGR